MSKNDGGPIFPTPDKVQTNYFGTRVTHEVVSGSTGLSLRDYYAGQVIGNILLLNMKDGYIDDVAINKSRNLAFKLADAMIAEMGIK